MDNELRQRLASAAETDPMMREALKEIEWLDSRPFEEFPAYWHARLNDYAPPGWRHQAATNALRNDALAYEKQVIRRMFDELEAIAWRRGYVDSPSHTDMPLDEVLAYAKQQSPLGQLHAAYLRGFIEARAFLMLKATVVEHSKLAAQLEKLDSIVH
jgi:hypothetical protein